MAQLTLLQIVQDMLSRIEAEGVTTVVSGSTTPDALLCVNIANRTYETLITDAKWIHLRTYKSLTAGANLNELKAGTSDLYIDSKNIWYGVIDSEARIAYVDPEEFVRRTIGRTSTDSNITVINNIKVYNDRVPSFFTTFNDNALVFDAMPSGAGLVNTNSKALVYVEPTTRLSANASVYSLPNQIFPAFRDLCVARAVIELAGDETAGMRMERTALRKIAKLASSGNLIEKSDNAFQHLITRRSGTRAHRRILV